MVIEDAGRGCFMPVPSDLSAVRISIGLWFLDNILHLLPTHAPALCLCSGPTDLSICPLQVSSPSRRYPLLSRPSRCPPGKRMISSRPQDVGDDRWPVGHETGYVHWGFTLTRLVWVDPGDVHFSQNHCHPYPTSHSLARQGSDCAETALIQQKQKKLGSGSNLSLSGSA